MLFARQRCSIGSPELGKLKEFEKNNSMHTLKNSFRKTVKMFFFFSQTRFSTGAGWCCFSELFFSIPPIVFKPGGQQRPVLQLVDLLIHGAG